MLEKVLVESWNVLCLSAPYMLFGFFVAGLLKAFIPDDFIARHLGGNGRTSLLKAALFGVPIPLCSCGVLPAAAGIRKQGANKGATTAFLIATPETGVDSISVTWALLDPLMALFRPVAAFFTAIVTGQLVRIFDPEVRIVENRSVSLEKIPIFNSKQTPDNKQKTCRVGRKSNFYERLRGGLQFAFGDLFRDISGWFFLGVVIAGLISVFVSPELVEHWLGNPFVAMLVMLVVATPLYVCATASTPIAAALVLKGLNPGAALVFLLAGPATNAAALSVITKIVGKRATAIYLIGIMLASFGLGFAIDAIYSFTDLSAGWHAIVQEEHRTFPGTLSALTLLGLVLFQKKRVVCSDAGCTCG